MCCPKSLSTLPCPCQPVRSGDSGNSPAGDLLGISTQGLASFILLGREMESLRRIRRCYRESLKGPPT